METLMQYDPEVIIVQEKIFYDEIYNKPLWANINAVKNKRVHMIPRSPFNWFDRPPSFMRILGLQWTMSHIYPDTFNIDIKQETKKFYKLFLGVDITDEQVNSILLGE
jgi:iron complex transport system substrate-binding protein